ncbi:MAG: hypothetical protein RR865_09675 [Clostridia bacterium]
MKKSLALVLCLALLCVFPCILQNVMPAAIASEQTTANGMPQPAATQAATPAAHPSATQAATRAAAPSATQSTTPAETPSATQAATRAAQPAAMQPTPPPAERVPVPVASIRLPAGAQSLPLAQAQSFSVPSGLEDMYRLMLNANNQNDVHLMRMKNGRALLSLSCAFMPEGGQADALLALWPQIAEHIGKEVLFVNSDPSCAKLASHFGFDALEINTELAVGKDPMVVLNAKGIAFYRNTDFVELWMVSPAEVTYLYDETAAQELSADLADAAAAFQSMKFDLPVPAAQPALPFYMKPPMSDGLPASTLDLPTERYQDPRGYFSLELLKGSHVITKATPESKVSAVRTAFEQKYGAGGGIAFDMWFADVKSEAATLILAPGYQAVIELYSLPYPPFTGYSNADLLGLRDDVEEGLRQKLGYASILQSGLKPLAGVEQAYHQIWLRTQKNDMLLCLYACMEAPDFLRETDVFLMMDEPNPAVGNTVLNLVQTTLTFTTPVQ